MSGQSIGDRKFSFAVIADTHLNYEELGTNSPFEVNRLANRRLRYVIDDLNTRDLAHVIHLGDIVHPVPSNGDLYVNAASQFHEQVSRLKHPIHLIPGNHDVGDKRMAWSPAGGIRESYLEIYSQHFGSDRFDFEHQGIAFVGINAQLLGSELESETSHREWLRNTLRRNSDNRVFLFSHYPPFLYHPDEDEHYDNLGHQGREEILNLLEEFLVEALFTGHVHHFWYNNYSDCDCYLLPSTAFTRQDYSEMFRVAPNDNAFGRDDRDKLGYLIVHVHESGHTFDMVRCRGRQTGLNSSVSVSGGQIDPINPTTNQYPVLGFDLRHDWLEPVQIPPSGGLDEFDRKVVRNDYPLLALWEMGVRNLRIPLADLVDSDRRCRLIELTRLGFRFTLFSHLPPEYRIAELVLQNADLIESWEIAGKFKETSDFCDAIRGMMNDSDRKIRLFFSPLKNKEDIIQSGLTYYHVINHGFTRSDFEGSIDERFSGLATFDNFDGIVMRCGIDDSVQSTIMLATNIQQTVGLKVSVHLRLTEDSPAAFQDSEVLLCNRLAESMFCAWHFGADRIFSDTLTDNDRGYFPRIGLLDREFNPRSGATLAKIIHSLMSKLGRTVSGATSHMENGLSSLYFKTEFGESTVFLSRSAENQLSGKDLEQLVEKGGFWLNLETEHLDERPPKFNGLPAIYVKFS